ncbi:fumarylacetoacetate hydrolase family protein [Maricurvus nonylphenolicus]|uniref:fumarylacetoacetate hydrolase family protein n=1 Tax=Maricurvus nonylphenolicus TaxID=1008307 RepID=UPI0036F2F371
MKLATFQVDDGISWGAVTDKGIIDLGKKSGITDIKQGLKEGVRHLEEFLSGDTDWSAADVKFLPPILDSSHIIGIGLNTKSHFEETAELMGREPGVYPKFPRLFMRSPFSYVGHQQPMLVPSTSSYLDYEGEIAIIIGKEGRNIDKNNALEHIGGYSCFNDGSIRDYQMHSNQVTAGKNFASSGAFGPWLLTADEVSDPNNLSLTTRVNGEVRQRLEMDDLIFSFAELISYISQIFPLQVGDVILTGSPEGVGAISNRWLQQGDTVEVTIPQIGTLCNPIQQDN